jgi:dihydrofolate reductase
MGRKTYESIGRPLEGRENIVLTRQKGFAPPGVRVAAGLEEALALACRLAQEHGAQEVMVIGGAEVFRAALARTGRIYLTRVQARPNGDTYFPDIGWDAWTETSRQPMPRQPADQYPADFIVLDRHR